MIYQMPQLLLILTIVLESLTALTATADLGNTLQWYYTDGVTQIPPPGAPTLNVGSETYYVSQIDPIDESPKASLTVTTHALPNIAAGSDVTVCFGDQLFLSSGGGVGALYTWSGGIINGVAFTPTTRTGRDLYCYWYGCFWLSKY